MRVEIEIDLYLDLIIFLAKNSTHSDELPPCDVRRQGAVILDRLRDLRRKEE